MSCIIRKFKKTPILENYESNALLEMASDKASYEMWARNHAWELYQHLIFISVLESYLPNYVEHWAHEIRNFTEPVVTTKLKKNCKNLDRGATIEKYMMEPQMNPDFEDYGIEEFELALKNEISKGEKMLKDPSQKRKHGIIKVELAEIRKAYNIVGEFVEPNRERIQQFYNDFIAAANAKDVNLLDDAIQRFVDTKPIFDED